MFRRCVFYERTTKKSLEACPLPLGPARRWSFESINDAASVANGRTSSALEAFPMRASLLGLAFAACSACGPVLLGQEPTEEDAGDPSSAVPQVSVTVANVGCAGCFEVRASGLGGDAPYRFEWDDGSDAEKRQVCPGDGADSVSVIAVDARSRRSAAALAQLEFPNANCPQPPPLLCIHNPSFEGRPAFNNTGAENFDGAPWNSCPQPSLNTPDIVNETIEQPIAVLPPATDGNTYIGLQEGEQVSQPLCEPLAGGEELYLKLDARRLSLGVMPDTELPFLEIWGGLSTTCSQHQLLWASDPLSLTWQTLCAKLRPLQYMDQITLRINTDGSLPTVTYLLVDNLVPVEKCP